MLNAQAHGGLLHIYVGASCKLSKILKQKCGDMLLLHAFSGLTFSALTLLVGREEEHAACKNCVVRCWRVYLSGARCK